MKSPSKSGQIKSKKRVKEFGEVYTQEREVKAMLDLVKEESYRIDSLFLEPACGNGNFLIEILKRKLSASKTKEEVLIALSSIYAIDILEDNVLESKKRLYELVQENLTQEESFLIMNQNIVCGDSLELLNNSFYRNMKFDVIIGNPPYQLNDGGGTGSSAKPLYHKFVEKAKELNPRYITMIIPSRWFVGGKGLDEFRYIMLNDRRIKYLVDFPNSKECFPGNDIKGGVCYFLWDNHYKGDCEIKTVEGSTIEVAKRPLLEEGMDTFIRENKGISILRKVQQFGEESFSGLVSNRKPFGLESTYKGIDEKTNEKNILLYGNKNRSYISETEVLKNKELIKMHKLLVSKAIGSGNTKTDWIKPFIADLVSCCTETYLILYTSTNKNEVENVLTYTQTKFFHFLMGLKKITQNTTKSTYSFIPMQDFSKPWTDAELYKKYGLTQEEIDYIESMIRPMGSKQD